MLCEEYSVSTSLTCPKCFSEVEVLKNQVKETIWGNADGETGTVDTTEFVKKMEKDYEKLKEEIRSKFSE